MVEYPKAGTGFMLSGFLGNLDKRHSKRRQKRICAQYWLSRRDEESA